LEISEKRLENSEKRLENSEKRLKNSENRQAGHPEEMATLKTEHKSRQLTSRQPKEKSLFFDFLDVSLN
jgi:hypothetical protein